MDVTSRWRERVVEQGTCLVWTGAVNPAGYGRRRSEGRMVLVHRWAYETFVGPIPDGMVTDHLCRNPPCCAPLHLEVVTNRENVERGRAAEVQRERGLARTHCRNGHEFTPENTRMDRDTRGRLYRACRACGAASSRRQHNQKKEQ